MKHGRKQPYTEIGVKRLPCSRCGGKSLFQWQICADGNLFRPLCAKCDVDLNRMVLEWVGDPAREAKMATYSARVLGKV